MIASLVYSTGRTPYSTPRTDYRWNVVRETLVSNYIGKRNRSDEVISAIKLSCYETIVLTLKIGTDIDHDAGRRPHTARWDELRNVLGFRLAPSKPTSARPERTFESQMERAIGMPHRREMGCSVYSSEEHSRGWHLGTSCCDLARGHLCSTPKTSPCSRTSSVCSV